MVVMSKRCLAMVLYNPAAADEQQGGDAKRPRPVGADAAAAAAAPPPVVADDVQPINAVPWPRPPAPLLSGVGFEPACLRTHLLQVLRLRSDLPMHFIDAKAVTSTDLDAHQNRFRLPTTGVLERLRPLLNQNELDAANLLYEPEPRAKPLKQLPAPGNSAAAANDGSSSSEQQPPPPAEQQKMEKKKKRKGRVHGGLPVRLVDLAAGASMELRLCRWESSHGTIVKGEGYLDFIRRCSFNEKDVVVEIWAFKQRAFRNFGVTMCDDSILHLFILIKESAPKTCRYCPLLASGRTC